MTLLASWGSEAADTVQTLPPLTLTVVDTQSEKPLPGITVHYMVIRETHWTVFPLTIEAHIDSTIVAPTTAKTDSNGVVTFKDIRVELESYWLLPKEQLIDSEVLFINLDPLPEPPKYMLYKDKYQYLRSTLPFLENLYRPNERYLGYLLTTARISAAHEREQEVATARFEPETFRGDQERRFVARLKSVATDAQPGVPSDGTRTGGPVHR